MKYYIIPLFLILSYKGLGHPMPNSVVNMSIQDKSILFELQLPLNELELAMGNGIQSKTDAEIHNMESALKKYILNHIHIKDSHGEYWIRFLKKIEIQSIANSDSGPYRELKVWLETTPPNPIALRQFDLYYDVISHQVATHSTFINIANDWKNGIHDGNIKNIGVISRNITLDKMLPFHVNLEQGNNWKGFQSMLLLGMEHIRLGYDHLLFLFLLLLSAPLGMVDRNWSHYLGHKESLKILIKIITAFTIGHSIALLLGTLGYNPFPTQWVEVTIAISITITAIHLIKPIIYNKELWIASGFGLIHGLAFSEVLIRLGLNNAQLAISLLGFNLGIELIQLLLVLIILPFILLLCNYQFKFYQSITILIAIASILISFYWIVDRVFLF